MSNISTLQTLQERVTERIRASFVDLIPQEMWDQMVKTQIDAYMQTELPKLVKAELEAHLRAIVKAELQKPEWAEQWNGGAKSVAGDMVRAIVKENADQIVSAFFGSMVQTVVQDVRYGLQNGRY